MSAKKALVLKGKYLPEYVEAFQERKDDYCKNKCSYRELPLCPMRDGPTCMRILAEAGIFP